MRVCVLQFSPGTDLAANMAQVTALIDDAVASARPDLVSLPEMWSCLGGDAEVKRQTAVHLPGPCHAFLADLARRHRLVLHGGSIGERDGDRLYNTSLVFGPDGAELGRYRKIHLFDITTPSGLHYGESKLFGSGDRIVVCETPVGRLGLSVCYDLRFPDLYAALRARDADMILVPAAFTAETGAAHWEILLRARAIETQTPVIAAATMGMHHDARGAPRTTWGHAMIIDAWGRICAGLTDQPGFAVADLDMAETARVRQQMPLAAHRRLPL